MPDVPEMSGLPEEIPAILKLAGLDIEIPDAAEELAKLVADGTTFAQVDAAPTDLLQPLSLEGEDTVPLKDARFTLGGSFDAQLAVAIFNEPTDQDDDQILQPTAGKAWLKYKLAAGVKGSAGGNVNGLEFGLQGELGASLLQYRAHEPGDPVGLSLIADVQSFRLPLLVDDIRGLGDGDILACTVRGKLALHAKLTWADTLSTALSALDARLGAAGVSAIKLNLGASVGINLTVEDDYRLVFQPGSQTGTTRIDVRKTKGRTAGVSAGLKVEARVADPAALQEALTAYATGRLGQPWAKVQALIGRIDSALSFQGLNADERVLAEQVGARLGLADLQQDWDELKTRLTRLPEDLSERLEHALRTKVNAEMKMEYSRISTEQVILACELKKAPLARHHHDLLRGNLTELLDNLAAQKDGYKLIEYLKTTKITKQLSFGLSIGIGKWAASGTDEVFEKWERQVDLKEEHERLSFTGRRTYKAKWGDKTYHYAFGLSGSMASFSNARKANASEFDYSMSFNWSWREPLTAALLSDALDLANVWKILDQRDNEANLDTLLAQADGTPLVEVEIKVLDTGVRSLLAVPRKEFEDAWIEAMAAALPRVHRSPRLFRARLRDRVRVYGGAARFAFEQSAGAEIEAIAGRIDYDPLDEPNTLLQLRRIDQGAIQDGVLPDLGLKVLWTSSTATTRPAGRHKRARQALDGLTEAISGNLQPEHIEQTFKEIEELMTRPYECRLLGRVVAGLVADRRPNEIVKTLRVTLENGTVILI